ncbi:MAG: hypothetical protein KAJ49_11190 [Arcobacteraceae bacterium]|nr:hypothetical protein [Arcobacteraceae bacterium]
MEQKTSLMGKVRIRTKIIVPTILVLVLSNLLSIFTSANQMNDLAKNNSKIALSQLTDSIFLNLRTAMNTGDSTIIADAEEKSRKDIKGLERFVVAQGADMLELFNPHLTLTKDKNILEVFSSKKEKIIESFENGKHTLRSLRPMVATAECLYCHVNQKEGDIIGVMDLTFNLEESDLIINNTVNNLIWQAIIVLLFITIFMTLLIRKATKPIAVFQKGLESFFKYINKEEENVRYIDGYSQDEIGELVASVNKNIDETVAGVHKDESVITEAKKVCQEASMGVFDVKIIAEAHSPELNDLKNLVNNLIDSVGYNVSRVSNVLNSYDNGDYTARINSKGSTSGIMKEVFTKVDALGTGLTQNAKTNLQNGERLQDDAQSLETSISTIQSFLTEQSTQLNSSVGELSQITQAIRETTTNSISMASYASDVTSSVQNGQELANKTSSEMDEIALQINSINKAITVIDQISFQTNILSLNAAVEAATAGEAGKGFAVVAGEVRNLANKSADAANEIKALVESATKKANDGKIISDNMKDGYDQLNEHITATINLIKEVTTASKNQQQSIEQINTSINVIQSQTKQSTQMAEDASDIAIHTSQLASTIVKDASEKKFD